MTGWLQQGARFGVIGLMATLVHLGIAWIANTSLGLSEYLSNGMGFAVAFAVSYMGHFYWTFGRQRDHARHLSRFIAVAGFGYALSNLIVWIVVKRMGHSFELALLVMLMTVPLSTWLISRFWAFKPRPE